MEKLFVTSFDKNCLVGKFGNVNVSACYSADGLRTTLVVDVPLITRIKRRLFNKKIKITYAPLLDTKDFPYDLLNGLLERLRVVTKNTYWTKTTPDANGTSVLYFEKDRFKNFLTDYNK